MFNLQNQKCQYFLSRSQNLPIIGKKLMLYLQVYFWFNKVVLIPIVQKSIEILTEVMISIFQADQTSFLVNFVELNRQILLNCNTQLDLVAQRLLKIVKYKHIRLESKVQIRQLIRSVTKLDKTSIKLGKLMLSKTKLYSRIQMLR
ncbi:unnamed protein product [Paramecium octaurelia]|uniref:Uncharacterized protein n=1 Tax=Paramecium octaurelia TaxID=43137 RepID=A0A8S1TVR3_PAROT|nr:unnamed protein product [Paramecium octaurelia]